MTARQRRRGCSSFARLLPLPSSLVLALCSTLALPPASAQTAESAVTLGEVFVSTTKSGLQLEDSPRAVSVVTQENLQSQATSGGIQEALATLPGVEYARTGGLGGQIVMRGFSSSKQRSMLAIDGDRFRGRSLLELNVIDPFAVERIEVIRGPASSIWGADAMNGVVNVITRRARVSRDAPFALSAKIRGLEYNSVNRMRAGRAEAIGGGDGFDVLIGLTYREADDYRTPLGKAANSRYDSKGLDFRIGYSPTAKTRYEVAGRYQDVTTGRAGGLGAAPGAPYFKIGESPIKEKYLKLGVESREAGSWADTVNASLYVRQLSTHIYQDNATTPTGQLSPTTAHPTIQARTPTVFGGRLNAVKGVGDHLLAYGFDFYRERFSGPKGRSHTTSTSTGAPMGATMCPFTGAPIPAGSSWCPMARDTTQTNFGLHLNDDWQAARRLMLSGALRIDYIRTVIDSNPIPGETLSLRDQNGNPVPVNITRIIDEAGHRRVDRPVTGSLGGVWKVTPAWSAVAQVSRGFMAPSGNMRATSSFGGSSPSLPAPGLKPERSTVYEAGLRYAFSGARLNLTAFRSRYKDLILYRRTGLYNQLPNGNTYEFSQYENIASVTIDGVEFDGQWRIDPTWQVSGVLTAARGTDKMSNQPLEEIPPLSGRFSTRYGREGGAWSVEGVVRGAARRTRVNPNMERPRPGYAAFDLYASADLGKLIDGNFKRWKAVLGLQNAFNQTIVNPVAAENIRYDRTLTNPLVEPGRALMIRFIQSD